MQEIEYIESENFSALEDFDTCLNALFYSLFSGPGKEVEGFKVDTIGVGLA